MDHALVTPVPDEFTYDSLEVVKQLSEIIPVSEGTEYVGVVSRQKTHTKST